MKIKRSIKKIMVLSLWSVLTIAFVVLLSAASNKHRADNLQTEPEIYINYKSGLYFIDEQEIKDIIYNSLHRNLDGYTVEEFELSKVENNISTNPYVKSADAYIDMSGKLRVNIIQREPIVRVINSRGVSYYIDNYGEKIPVNSNFTARVPVTTGNIWDNGTTTGELQEQVLKDIYILAKYINSDKYLNALTEQIYVTETGEFEIIPKIENHAVLLGGVDNLDGKFRKLFIFYREGLKNVGWNQYSMIDLRFDKQVVCKKRSI